MRFFCFFATNKLISAINRDVNEREKEKRVRLGDKFVRFDYLQWKAIMAVAASYIFSWKCRHMKLNKTGISAFGWFVLSRSSQWDTLNSSWWKSKCIETSTNENCSYFLHQHHNAFINDSTDCNDKCTRNCRIDSNASMFLWCFRLYLNCFWIRNENDLFTSKNIVGFSDKNVNEFMLQMYRNIRHQIEPKRHIDVVQLYTIYEKYQTNQIYNLRHKKNKNKKKKSMKIIHIFVFFPFEHGFCLSAYCTAFNAIFCLRWIFNDFTFIFTWFRRRSK